MGKGSGREAPAGFFDNYTKAIAGYKQINERRVSCNGSLR